MVVHPASPLVRLAALQGNSHGHPASRKRLPALGEPHRLAVVHLLREAPRRPADLATELSISRPALSRHLRVLRKSGLVAEQTLEDDLRGRVYQLRREAFSELQEWLTEMEAFWNTQLQAV